MNTAKTEDEEWRELAAELRQMQADFEAGVDVEADPRDTFISTVTGVLALQRQMRLSEEMVVMLLHLVVAAGDDYEVDLSIAELARITDKHPKTVEKMVARLKELDLIERPKARGSRRAFDLTRLKHTMSGFALSEMMEGTKQMLRTLEDRSNAQARRTRRS